MPPDKKRFMKSYRPAIWSNMPATCSFLLFPESLNGTMVSCEYLDMKHKDTSRFRVSGVEFRVYIAPHMTIKSAQYVISSPDHTKCPKPDRPEYAFIGRSNVGKSS